MNYIIKLVDDTRKANYTGRELRFDPESLAWVSEPAKKLAVIEKIYPSVVKFCFKGSDIVFMARSADFSEINLSK
jgi:hypothetical protein